MRELGQIVRTCIKPDVRKEISECRSIMTGVSSFRSSDNKMLDKLVDLNRAGKLR